LWKELILTPYDYSKDALNDPDTRDLMSKMSFEHGGPEYDRRYPEGIPTSIVVTVNNQEYNSGLVMFPSGHSANHDCDLVDILHNKFQVLGSIAVGENKVGQLINQLSDLQNKSSEDIKHLYEADIIYRDPID